MWPLENIRPLNSLDISLKFWSSFYNICLISWQHALLVTFQIFKNSFSVIDCHTFDSIISSRLPERQAYKSIFLSPRGLKRMISYLFMWSEFVCFYCSIQGSWVGFSSDLGRNHLWELKWVTGLSAGMSYRFSINHLVWYKGMQI